MVLVTEVTGRRDPSKHFGHMLHPFVQAKHGLPIEEPTPTVRTITHQNLIAKVPRLVGMSGTLVGEERELRQLYARDSSRPLVLQIPPRVSPRIKREPVVLCLTKDHKWTATAQEILEYEKPEPPPILVITATVQDSHGLAEQLNKAARLRARQL